MRTSYCVVLLTFLAIAGCKMDMFKQYMPAATANKAVNVPEHAGLVAYNIPSIIAETLPVDASGAYYFVEDDTSKIVSVVNILPSQSSKTVFTKDFFDQFDTKRKYRVYYLSNKDSTQPTTIPMVG